MRLILLAILAFPTLVWSQDQKVCANLNEAVRGLDYQIQNLNLGPTCKEQKLFEDSNAPLSAGLKTSLEPYFETFNCKNVSSIELEITKLENQIALFKDIQEMKQKVKSGEDLVTIKETPQLVNASKVFYENLQIARGLEVILAENPKLSDLQQKFESYCKEKPSLCPDNVKASLQAKVNEAQISEVDLKKLKDALKVRNDKEEYSYSKILDSIKPPLNGKIALADLKSLSTLNLVSDDKDGILSLDPSLKDIRTYTKSDMDRFEQLRKDLLARQEWEMKSKISMVLHHFKDSILNDVCSKALDITSDNFSECFTSIANHPLNKTKRHEVAIKGLIENLKDGFHHLNRLDTCVPDEKGAFSSDCDKLMSQNLEELTGKAAQLKELRNQIYTQKPHMQKFKDFAMSKVVALGCMTQDNSNISAGCSNDLGSISRELLALTDSASQITYLVSPPQKDLEISQLCSEDETTFAGREVICQTSTPRTERKPAEKINPLAEGKKTSVNPDIKRTTVGGALVNAGLAQTGAQLMRSVFMPTPPMPINQFPMYNPRNQVAPPMAPPLTLSNYLVNNKIPVLRLR